MTRNRKINRWEFIRYSCHFINRGGMKNTPRSHTPSSARQRVSARHCCLLCWLSAFRICQSGGVESSLPLGLEEKDIIPFSPVWSVEPFHGPRRRSFPALPDTMRAFSAIFISHGGSGLGLLEPPFPLKKPAAYPTFRTGSRVTRCPKLSRRLTR